MRKRGLQLPEDKTMEPRRRTDGPLDEASAIETVLDEDERAAAIRHTQTSIWGRWATGGQPLPTGIRESMRVRFGHDFDHVRVHIGIDGFGGPRVRAYASGSDIWFRGAKEATDLGLLAHELTHVVQQSRGDTSSLQMAGGDAARRQTLEQEAKDSNRGQRFTQQVSTRNLSTDTTGRVVQFDVEADVERELVPLPSTENPSITPVAKRSREDIVDQRRARLRALFVSFTVEQAQRMHERLRQRRRGDRLSEKFYDILATATRVELIGVLATKSVATPSATTSKSRSVGDVLRVDQAIQIRGLPTEQTNYIDRSFAYLFSAPLGDVYVLANSQDHPELGIPVPKGEFFIDTDPLAGEAFNYGLVYKTKTVAEAVMADVKRETPGFVIMMYYLRDGYIFPVILSESTIPNLMPHIRKMRDGDLADLRATARTFEDLLWWYVSARLPIRIKSGVPPTAPSTVGAVVSFNAARVAEELLAATKGLANPGQKMLAAARQLSGIANLSALQKTQVILEYFGKIGFGISKAGVVDEGAHLVMYSEDSRYAFRFIKGTGKILYGKFDLALRDYIWQPF